MNYVSDRSICIVKNILYRGLGLLVHMFCIVCASQRSTCFVYLPLGQVEIAFELPNLRIHTFKICLFTEIHIKYEAVKEYLPVQMDKSDSCSTVLAQSQFYLPRVGGQY